VSKRPRSVGDIPEAVPLFPLSGALLLPQLQRPLQVFEDRYIALIDEILGADRLIGIIQPQSSDEESPAGKTARLRDVGSLGYLTHFEEMSDGRYLIGLDGVCRFDLAEEIETEAPYRMARISVERYGADFRPNTGESEVDRPRFMEMMRNYAEYAELDLDWKQVEKTGTAELVNMCCMLSPYGATEMQALLEAQSLRERAETLIALAELEMARATAGTTLQ